MSLAQGLELSCCLLWSVPLFLQISKESLFLPVQHSINCALDYSSVNYLYMCSPCPSSVYRALPVMFGFHHMYVVMSSTLISSVHRTVPPVLGFHHTCTSFCHAVLNCPLDCTSLVCGHLHRVHLCKILMKNVT